MGVLSLPKDEVAQKRVGNHREVGSLKRLDGRVKKTRFDSGYLSLVFLYFWLFFVLQTDQALIDPG